MLKNNNSQAITNMAKHSLRGSKRRNGSIILAVFLATFLLTTIFTVGETWFHMKKTQDIRMDGMDSDAYVYGGVTEKQRQMCRENPDIFAAGAEGIAGAAVETEFDDTIDSALLWVDETCWNDLQKPGRRWEKGRYPQDENEIMATKAALKECGLGDLRIGDEFEMTYTDSLGEHKKTFTISGICQDYVNRKEIYVSKAFFEKSGRKLEEYGWGLLYIKFKSSFVTQDMIDDLEQRLDLNKKQALHFTGMAAQSMARLLLGIASLTLVTCLTAFLLIYNIMYLSISGNVRYYGLLQTIGMTESQVRRLVNRQMLFMSAVGISGGLLLGAAVSFVLVPAVVNNLGIHDSSQIEITFHPWIFLMTILLTSMTVYLGSRKPVKLAAETSPIAALGYRAVDGRRKSSGLQKGSLLWRIAARQFGRDKKKTAMVVSTLGICLSFFLCAVTLIQSQAPRTLVSNYMDMDMVLKNDTMMMKERNKWKPLMDKAFMEKLQENDDIADIHTISNEQIVIPWEPQLLEYWMTECYDIYFEETYEDVKADYQQHPEKYASFLIGIDDEEFRHLNSSLETPVDKEDFLAGKSCIMLRSGLWAVKLEKVVGKSISYYLGSEYLAGRYMDDPDAYMEASNPKKFQMKVEGMTDDDSGFYGGVQGVTPNLIVSDTFLKRIVKDPYVSKVGIRYREEYDENVETAVKKMIEDSQYSRDFSYDSKLEELKATTQAQGNMMGVGIGIALVLGFIGIMNYINASVGNIQSRQTSLSIMESLGMTGRQLKKLLVYEGSLYALASIAFAMTIGLGVTYYLYQSMNERGIPFEVPVIPMLAVCLLILAACAVIPLIAYWSMEKKGSIIERVRGFE